MKTIKPKRMWGMNPIARAKIIQPLRDAIILTGTKRGDYDQPRLVFPADADEAMVEQLAKFVAECDGYRITSDSGTRSGGYYATAHAVLRSLGFSVGGRKKR